MRYTEYHAGKAVNKDKSLLPEALAKLAAYEDLELLPEEINLLMRNLEKNVCTGCWLKDEAATAGKIKL